MKKMIVGLVAATAVVAPIALTAAPAQADWGSPNCVTKNEWKKVKVGMSRAQVKRITGTTGKVVWSSLDADGWSLDQDIDYRQCNRYGKPASKYSNIYMAFANYEWDYPTNIRKTMSVDYKGSWSTVY